ncbi:MAG: FAD-dependent oxidoreductase [Bacteroidota bacterium]
MSIAVAGISNLLASCIPKRKIKGEIIGASSAVGHLLRDKKQEPSGETITTKVVIVGGGVSGLSAARYLHQQVITDFILLDLEPEVGGNAASGKNKTSGYPWGAHYVPIPNNDLTEYISFLKDADVVTGFNGAGLPVYNDYYLCFDPEDRLYINGRWQEGLIPNFGVPDADKIQVQRFLELMDHFRHSKGNDEKYVFAIPVDNSSKDPSFTRFDTITMKQWLTEVGFTSSYLHSYVNYCTRDDFGTRHDECSAWAGIHYFAGRKGKGSNAEHSDLLTWPEGNGFLIGHLKKSLADQIHTRCLATRITPGDKTVRVDYFDVNSGQVKTIEAEQCILAVPQFIAGRLLQDEARLKIVKAQFRYSPWMVANLTVKNLEERSGAPLSWDNVLFESESLGYVDATHQLTQQHVPKRNLTYYLPLTQQDPVTERKAAHTKTHADWVTLIMEDLKKIHPNIEDATEELNVMIWGHAMAQPTPGFIFNNTRPELAASLQNRVHFAHTDLAGISIFEEGFYQGLAAAKKVITQLS